MELQATLQAINFHYLLSTWAYKPILKVIIRKKWKIEKHFFVININNDCINMKGSISRISYQCRLLPLHSELWVTLRNVDQLMHILSDLCFVVHSPSCQSKANKICYLVKKRTRKMNLKILLGPITWEFCTKEHQSFLFTKVGLTKTCIEWLF